jgi:hypothetical protein
MLNFKFDYQYFAKGALHAMLKKPTSVLGKKVNKQSSKKFGNTTIQESLLSVMKSTPLKNFINKEMLMNKVDVMELMLTGNKRQAEELLKKLYRKAYLKMSLSRQKQSKSFIKIHRLYAVGTGETLMKTQVAIKSRGQSKDATV